MQVRGNRQEAVAHADVLARDVGLDMTAYWQPTAAGYFGRVSKERILEAVREGVSAQAAENVARMKNQAITEAAEKALAQTQTRWLPVCCVSRTRRRPDSRGTQEDRVRGPPFLRRRTACAD